MVTVNCARIIYGNQVATNGVVHVIDRVISAVGNTIQDVIEVNDDLTTLSVSTDHREQKYMRTRGDALDLIGSEGIARLSHDTECARNVGNVILTGEEHGKRLLIFFFEGGGGFRTFECLHS